MTKATVRSEAGWSWQALVALVRWSGIPWLVRNTWARNRVTIFRYHDPDPRSLRRQLRYLARAYTFITLDQLVSAIESGDWSGIPPQSLVVTFDDGWRGNAELFEICREFGVVPTAYVCSGLVGTRRHFWWTEAGRDVQALKGMSPVQLEARLRKATGFGFTRDYPDRQALSREELTAARGLASFQSHASFHRDLAKATALEREEEIAGSKRALEDLLGTRCDHLSYPNGSYDDEVAEVVRRAGYRSARTTDVGWNTPRTDPFRLKIAGGPDRGGANAAAASLFGMYIRMLLRGNFTGRFRDARVGRRRRRSTRRRALVTDVESRCGLAACRALARAGYSVTAVATRTRAPGHWSRSCSERRVAPDPRVNRLAFTETLESLVAPGEYDALLFGSDAVLLAVSEARAALEPHLAIGLPPHDAVERSTDKLALATAAETVGLASPDTVLCPSPACAAAAAAVLGYPVVVKARRSVTPTADGLRERGSRRVEHPSALELVLAGHESDVLVQRPVDGSVWSFAGVFAGGRMLASVVSRYERTWPATGGSASFSETVPAPEGLPGRVSALLLELGWQGVFELELVRRNDGAFVVIDLNPRLYGSLAVALAAGVPIPVVWCRWLCGEDPVAQVARPGARYRCEDADLRHALQSLRSRRLREALATLRPRRRVAHAYFSLRDPLPLVGRALQMAARRVSPPTAPVGAAPGPSEEVGAVR